MSYIDIVFDGPPGPESGRFVEVEDETGKSIDAGEWLESLDGFHRLRIPMQHSESEQSLGEFWASTNPETNKLNLSHTGDPYIFASVGPHQNPGVKHVRVRITLLSDK